VRFAAVRADAHRRSLLHLPPRITFHLFYPSRLTPCPPTAEEAIALLARIRARGIRAGIALKPGTDVAAVLPLAPHADMVLVMTVEPGFGGQSFMPAMMEKVRVLRSAFPALDIEVDGGLGPATIGAAAEAGANVIVAGTSIFRASDAADAIRQLRDVVAASAGKGAPESK
jgi:ribulose-phosphate 3-epimerase